MTNIVVLGTGMAGFGASHKLNAEGYKPVVYDKRILRRPYGVISGQERFPVRSWSTHFIHKEREYRICSPAISTRNMRPFRSSSTITGVAIG